MNKLEFLDQAGEWYYDDATNTVYFWTPKGDSPANYTVRGSVHKDGFYLNYADYVTIQDIEILHHSEKSIHLNKSDYISINNNDLSYPDGFGIFTPSNATHYTITNNKVIGANHYGMMIRISHSTVSDNSISKIALLENIGLTGTGADNYGGGIYLAGEDGNNVLKYNRITETGYNGILFAKPDNIIEYNFIDGACLLKGDMGGIYTSWYNRVAPTGPEGSIVRNNIILNVVGEKYGYTSLRDFGEGIYIDESARGVIVENNTIAHCKNAGIYLHRTENTIVRNNTILDARQSIHIVKYSGSTKSNINSNIMVCASDKDDYLKRQVMVNLQSGNAAFDNNKYINPYASDGIFKVGSPYYSFSEWKSSTGQDKNSMANVTPLKSGEKEQLFYNDTKSDKTINLGSKVYLDIEGNKVTGSFTLKPFTSRILIGTNSETSVNENKSPVVHDQYFEFFAPKKVNDFIGKVDASDPDAGQELTYSITSGNEGGLFGLNSTTGEIYTKSEITSSTSLSVEMIVEVKDNSDKPLSANAVITIKIKAGEIEQIADVTAPVISSFSIPSTSESLIVPVNVTASDNVAVTGWKLGETSTAPLAGDQDWVTSAPAEFAFSSEGVKTLYAWAKDAEGNISASANGTVTISIEDEKTVTPEEDEKTVTPDSTEYVTICEGENYLGWAESGTYERTISDEENIETQGINQIGNSDFSDGATGWSSWGDTGYSLEITENTSDYISSSASMQINCVANSTLISKLQLTSKSNITVEAGKEYELTFYAKASVPFEIQHLVVMKRTSPYTHYGSFSAIKPAVTTEWTQFKLKFTATETATDGSFRFYLGKTFPVGESLYLDDISFSEVQEETLQSEAKITTILTVNPVVNATEEVTIDEGDNYLGWTDAGEYTRTLVSSAGCDSIITTILTVIPSQIIEEKPGTEYVSICEGEEYNGWTESGTYERILTNEEKITTEGSNQIGNSDFSDGATGWSSWGDTGYRLEITESTSDYISSSASMQINCIANGTLISKLQLTSKSNITVEAGKEYELTFYAKASVPFDIQHLVVMKRTSPYTHYGSFSSINPAVTTEWTQFKLKFTATETATDGSFRFYLGKTFPVGESLYLDDISFSEVQEETLQSEEIITTILTVNPVVNATEEVTIDEGDNYLGWSDSGEYTRTLVSSAGCDSIITTILTVMPSQEIEVMAETEYVSICEGEDYNGWTESGVYEWEIKSETGSVVLMTTHLNVEATKYVTETIKIWANEDYNGWTEEGHYERVLESASGCDSVVVTKLIVKGKSFDNSNESIILNDPLINQGSTNDFKLYPNPAQTYINVEYQVQPEPNTRLEIVDGSGRIVFSQEVGSSLNRIDFQQLNPGMYFLRSINNQYQKVEKFVIE